MFTEYTRKEPHERRRNDAGKRICIRAIANKRKNSAYDRNQKLTDSKTRPDTRLVMSSFVPSLIASFLIIPSPAPFINSYPFPSPCAIPGGLNSQKMRFRAFGKFALRMDRRMNGPMDGPTDGWTDPIIEMRGCIKKLPCGEVIGVRGRHVALILL